MQTTLIPIEGGWHGLWNGIHAKGFKAWDVYLDLFGRYAEPHRYYHGFPHVMEMLKEFEHVKHLCINPNAVEMSLWCGRAVYRMDWANNEEKSAEFIKKILDQAQVAELFIREVTRLILLTKKQRTTQKDHDGALRLDIELAVLGSSPGVFSQYERNIRKEYDSVGISREAFIAQRTEILIQLIIQKFIYRTQYFREKYEQSARVNLDGSFGRLRTSV